MNEARPIRIDLRVARGPAAQQRALDVWLDVRHARADESPAAAIVEGAGFALKLPEDIPLLRLAPGCACCTGLLPLKVGLTRLLRTQRPQAVLLVIATEEHRQRLIGLLGRGELGVRCEIAAEEGENDEQQDGAGQRHRDRLPDRRAG